MTPPKSKITVLIVTAASYRFRFPALGAARDDRGLSRRSGDIRERRIVGREHVDHRTDRRLKAVLHEHVHRALSYGHDAVDVGDEVARSDDVVPEEGSRDHSTDCRGGVA